MILETKQFKEACAKVLFALDKEVDLYGLAELIELKTYENKLYLNVTNNEYFVSVKFDLKEPDELKATVSANTFLKLVSQLTTENIELNVADNYLNIKANGNYKLPLIFKDTAMMELTPITIFNPTVEMAIDNEILKSILFYNSKELQKSTLYSKGGRALHEVQKLHYVDEQGAITFSVGACVNNFTLPKPIKILLNNKIVKLFKLFEDDTVDFVLGYDALSDDIIQTKIKLSTPSAELTAILNCDNTLLRQVPASKIRERATEVYKYSVSINKNILIQAINRLLTFTKDTKALAYFTFTPDTLTLSDVDSKNTESLVAKGFNDVNEYSMLLDLNDIKLTLETCVDPYITMSFGDASGQSIVISRLNVLNILSVCELE